MSRTCWKADLADVRVDFYQLAGAPAEQVIAGISEKIVAGDGRLIVVADDEVLLARLDRMLWDQEATSFLPHGVAGGADDARQPILLSTSPDAPNLARNMLIADGISHSPMPNIAQSLHASTMISDGCCWKFTIGR